MKSKRRHELQTNELADRLGHWIDKLRPYTVLISVLALGVAAIVVLSVYLLNQRERNQSDSWRFYFGTTAVTELREVADVYEGTLAGLWAAQRAADMESSEGVRLLFTDRAAAKTSLNAAVMGYKRVLASDKAKDDPMLYRRAHFGLAQTCEARGELDEALKHYAAVKEAAPNTSLAKAAQTRIELLEKPGAKKWYNWFTRQKPVKPVGWDQGTGTPLQPDSLPTTPGTDLEKLEDRKPEGFMEDAASSSETKPAEKPAGDPTEKPAGDPAEKPAAAPELTPPESAQPADVPAEKK